MALVRNCMQSSRLAKIFLVLCVLGGSAWLQYLMDDGLGIGFSQNVERNWEQFGLFNLHGKLVTNPGGFEATTNPKILAGYSPICFYPAYFSAQIFAWTGLGTMSFHILLALAVFWAVWDLLGRDNFAFAVAATAVLCPGYARWQKLLDPNAICILFGLPYTAIVVSVLGKPRLAFGAIIGLFVLTLAFTSLNWSTVWILGPCTLLLLGLPQISRRAVILFIILAGASSSAIVIVSLLVKAGGSHSGTGNLAEFVRGYLWGDTGYGVGLTTGKAVLRLSFVNGIGLLPLLVIFAWPAAKYFQRGNPKNWLVISPFALAVAELAFMRNYFGHHPWMASPVLLAGLIFSLALWRVHIGPLAVARGRTVPQPRALFLPAIFLLSFIYGFAVMMFFRANETNQLSLVKLIRHHSKRSDCIVILKNLDPETAKMASRLDDIFDRRVSVADDIGHLPESKDQVVVLTSLPLSGAWNMMAQSSTDGTKSSSWLQHTANWFNHSIARRRRGDRLELADAYFLYKPKP